MKSVKEQLAKINKAHKCNTVEDCEMSMILVKNICIYNKLDEFTPEMQERYNSLAQKKLKIIQERGIKTKLDISDSDIPIWNAAIEQCMKIVNAHAKQQDSTGFLGGYDKDGVELLREPRRKMIIENMKSLMMK